MLLALSYQKPCIYCIKLRPADCNFFGLSFFSIMILQGDGGYDNWRYRGKPVMLTAERNHNKSEKYLNQTVSILRSIAALVSTYAVKILS